MKTTGRLHDVYRRDGKLIAAFELDSDVGIQDLSKYDLLDIKAERHVNKRSNTANGYLWVLVTEIAKAIDSTPVEVYRELIRTAGVCKVYDNIPEDKVANAIRLMTDTTDRGTGDFAESVFLRGKSVIVQYFGSSKYNSKEFSRLLDETVSEAKELGIDTIPPEELERLKRELDNTK